MRYTLNKATILAHRLAQPARTEEVLAEVAREYHPPYSRVRRFAGRRL